MVSTRSHTSGASSATERPQKRGASTTASNRPTKKSTTAKVGIPNVTVGNPVTTEVTLRNQDGQDVVVADTYRDQGVVFFMYPRANTPGCTKQACGFRDQIKTITEAGFAVYGLSGDAPNVLSSWKAKQSLPFDLLSDPDHHLISYFGSSLPDHKVQRSHVVILKGGVVGDIAAKVSPGDSVSRAVKFVEKNGGEAIREEEPAKEAEPAQEAEPAKEAELVKEAAPAQEAELVKEAAPTKEGMSTNKDTFAEGTVVTFDVELQTDASTTIKIQDLFKTRGAIFFMYPKADTPGCTTQACGYNDNLAAINAAGFDVYGLGADTPAELLAWKKSQKYMYTLLSDPDHQLIGYFGSSINDGTRVERSHVIVLPGGKVGQIEHNISPEDSVSKGLEFAKSHATVVVDATSKL